MKEITYDYSSYTAGLEFAMSLTSKFIILL